MKSTHYNELKQGAKRMRNLHIKIKLSPALRQQLTVARLRHLSNMRAAAEQGDEAAYREYKELADTIEARLAA